MRRVLGLALMAIFGFLSEAWAASFDCGKASTPIEKAVCADSALSEMDGLLGKAYKSALASAQDRSGLKAEQKGWLAQRDQCHDVVCLKSVYQARITALQTSSAVRNGITGTYKVKNDRDSFYGEVQVLKVAEDKIKFSMNVVYRMNTGELSGEIPLIGNGAVYSDAEWGECTVRFTFVERRLEVIQKGGCGMGLNVSGSGSYKLVSAAPPRL